MANSEIKTPHMISLDSRKSLSVTGVKEVGSFDDREITAHTDMGKLLIKGSNLNIKKLNLDTCDLEITGKICGLNYLDGCGEGSGFLKRIFK